MKEQNQIVFSDEGQRTIQERLENLRVDLGASGAMLFNQSGHLLIECGKHGDLDVNALLALLGNAMSASNAVIHLLRDAAAFDLHFYEGQTYDLHTARISDQIFLSLIFQRHIGSSRAGMVWISLRRMVTELRTLLNGAMLAPVSAEDVKIKSEGSAIPKPSTKLRRPMRERMLKVGDIFSPRQAPDALKPAVNPSPNVPEINSVFPWSPVESSQSIAEPVPESPVVSSQPVAEPVPESPAPPKLSPDVLNDPNHVLTYDEARALGLIDLDEPQGK